MLRALSTLTLGLSVACAAAPPALEPEPTAPAAVASPAAPAASADAAPEAAGLASDSGSAGDASVDAHGAPAVPAADGTPCSAPSDCESGICEGAGCEPASGECVSKARSCGAKLAWYCGCDGTSFQGSADCPGRRFAYPARCTPAAAWGPGAAPDGAPCLRARQCQSGVCEGPGCDDAHPGTCQPAMRGCGQSAVQYCGCDGRSFSSNPCPGVRFEATGACPVDPSTASVIRVLSITGQNAKLGDELKRALLASARLRSCHLASGEKDLTLTVDFEVDGKGQVGVKKLGGLPGNASGFERCLTVFARTTVVTAPAGAQGNAARLSAKLRFELKRTKP